jgi:hypothetical protein
MIRDTFELNPGLAELFKKKILQIAREVQFPEDLIDFESHIDMKGTYGDNLRIFYREYPRLSEKSDFLKRNPIQQLSKAQVEGAYRTYQKVNGVMPEATVPVIANTGETLSEPTTPTTPSYPVLSFSFNYVTNSFPEQERVERKERPQPEPREQSLEDMNVLDRIFPRVIPVSTQAGDNAIIQKHIIVYGRQGRGKSNTARWLVEEAKGRFNEKNVNVQVAKGEDFRDLLESDSWTNQLVQILIVEDITNVSFSDENLRDFFRIREVMAKQSQRLDGLVLVVFTCHRFYDTPKSFRSDYDGLIALSAPSNDYDYDFLERKFGDAWWLDKERKIAYLEQADESQIPEGKALILYRRTHKQRIQIPKIERQNSFLVQMEQYWKQETAPESTSFGPRSESQGIGVSLTRYVKVKQPEAAKAVKEPKTAKPERSEPKLALILILFASLLILFSKGLPTIALSSLSYATGIWLVAKWVKGKWRRF